MAFYPFPNERFDLGSESRFVRDIQNALNVAETGVFDFLTMCHVVVHKFKHGLNHHDPAVDGETWNSIFKIENEPDNTRAAERREATGGSEISPAVPFDGIATVGSVPRTDEAGATQRTTDTAPDQTEGNPEATTTGTTSATDENISAPANPDTNPDAPREDQPTVTAEEQQAQGAPAGGFTAAPTENASNDPSPAEKAAGAESADAGTNP